MADGKRLVGHAGAVLLRRCADGTGLTDALATSTAAGWQERAGVLVHLAIAIVLGATNLLEAEQLQRHHGPLFGPGASDSAARRTLAVLDEAALAKTAKVRARVRRHVWSLLHLRPGGFPWVMVAGKRLTGWIVRGRSTCFRRRPLPRTPVTAPSDQVRLAIRRRTLKIKLCRVL
ncbi:hypothetical protein [Streptomyces sp. NPDC002994]|uniref:hypothetical protein n=1 Tax=Streptomyces sp. NPDC002994 TaxID=3154441 RepID=UPI0033B9480A